MDLASGAWRYAALPLLAAVPLAFFTPAGSVAALALTVAVLLFFRDPERNPPSSGVVAPADGKVSVVREEDGRVRVGVFMNVTDVHVNRAPLDGVVRDVTHTPGAHRPAFSKDSDRNERVTVQFDEFRVVLIAGWFARRIHPYVEPGDDLARGDRIGHIAFGSRADVVLPAEYTRADVTVERGDKVRAGETVLARTK
ncbi:protein sorting system archaetidylserine decarboxylase [Halobacteriaceae archaeon GCM10025711]